MRLPGVDCGLIRRRVLVFSELYWVLFNFYPLSSKSSWSQRFLHEVPFSSLVPAIVFNEILNLDSSGFEIRLWVFELFIIWIWNLDGKWSELELLICEDDYVE